MSAHDGTHEAADRIREDERTKERDRAWERHRENEKGEDAHDDD